MPGRWFENDADDGPVDATLLGEFLGVDEAGADIWGPLTEGIWPEAFVAADFLPLGPAISVAMPSRSSATVTVTPADNPPPRSTVTSYKVYRSTNGGAFSLVHTITVATDSLTWLETGLPTATSPENTFTYRVAGVNDDGEGDFSNEAQVQWQGTPVDVQPTAPSGLAVSNLQPTSARYTWAETADATVDKHGIFENGVLVVDNIPGNATSFTRAGMTPGSVHANTTVRRYNGWPGGSPAGWSPASNPVSFTNPTAQATAQFLGHVPGKIYLGWSTDQGDSFAENQLDTQTPFGPGQSAGGFSSLLGCRRLYNKSANATEIARADANDRVVWISAKTSDWGVSAGVSGWGQVAAGNADAGIRSYFQSLVNRDRLTFFTMHHEPLGDASNPVTDGTTYCNAFRKVMQVVDAQYPGHKIIFLPCYEENRLRNLKVNGISIDWSRWLPESMLPGKGGARPWDLIGWDMYQYNANTSTSATAGVQFSHRWWRIHDLFTGDFLPAGSTSMPYMDFTPGVDLIFAIGEGTQRPGAFFQGTSNMTGAKYTRDYLDYVFAHIDQFALLSWFNSIGADPVYNDERLYPAATSAHPSFLQQTGDTELAINIYREKLKSGLTARSSI